MKHSRMLSLLLLTAMLASLASCGEAAPADDTTTSPSDDTTAEETTAVPFEVRDLGGREFVILARDVEGARPCEAFVEEETGDVLSDAIYQRNRAVEEALNVKITAYPTSRNKMNTEVQNLLLSGDHAFDAALVNFNTVSTVSVMEGALTPLDDIETLDLTASWWDAASLDAFALTENRYFMTGAYNLNATTAIYGLLFNHKIIKDNQLDSPYDLVLSGKWTMDSMHRMVKAAEQDLNGDSVMDDKDQHGLLCTDNGFQYLFYHTGEELVRKNASGRLEVNTTQRIHDAVDALLPVSVMGYKGSDAKAATLTQLFGSNTALFFQTSLQTTMELRTMEADYGIIPGPKMDEAQKDYCSPLAGSYVSMTMVPATNPDAASTGILLNALGCYSDEILMPALYESVLPAKLARDETSTRMIDIMNDTKMYVIQAAFNFGKATSIFNNIATAGTNTMASQLASYTPAIEASIADLMAKFE